MEHAATMLVWINEEILIRCGDRGQTELQLPEQLLKHREPLKRFGPIERDDAEAAGQGRIIPPLVDAYGAEQGQARERWIRLLWLKFAIDECL